MVTEMLSLIVAVKQKIQPSQIFAVGTRAGQIKTGLQRSDRVSKYNQLLRISEDVEDYRSPF